MILVAPDCQLCNLSTTRRNVVQPELPSTMRVLFVGRDPGDIEDRAGTPFHRSAPAGGLLRQLISQVGIPEEWCGYDNTVHCHTPSNRGPNIGEVRACGVWRRRVINSAKPGIVVLMGQEATEAWLTAEYKPKKPSYPLEEYGGTVVEKDGVQYVVCHHPSAALRNNKYRRMLVTELLVVARLLGIEPSHPPVQPAVALPLDVTECSLDIEASMMTGMVLGCGVAWRDVTEGCIKGRWFSYERGDMTELFQWLRLIPCRLIGHNMKYDIGKLNSIMYRPVNPDRLDDTMLMAYVLRRELEVKSLGLKELSLYDLGLSWSTLSELGNPEDMNDTTLGEYCLYDCAATLMLKERYYSMMGGM